MGRKKAETEELKEVTIKVPKKKMEENLEELEKKMEAEPTEIDLNENEVLKYRLINTQYSLVKKTVENAEMKKQMCLSEQKIVLDNFREFKNEIGEKYGLNYDNYDIDLEKQKLIKKQTYVSKNLI